jgi:hypothetical protein
MQTLEKFLVGNEVVMRCREVSPNGNQRLLITAPWASHQYRRELHATEDDRTIITTIVGSDEGPPEMPDVLDEVAAATAVVEKARCFHRRRALRAAASANGAV